MSLEASPSAPPPPALEMIQVTVGSLEDSDKIVLREVNWTAQLGDYWAIGGLQASGKSDFLAMAAGIMPPLEGTYRVLGREFSASYEAERLAARLPIGLVFDGGRLLSHLTIAENVSLPIRYHQDLNPQECRQQVQDLLELIGAAKRADDMPATVGRTWHQRIGLARSLALKPQILLLDNPLTGLDPQEAGWWLGMLHELSVGHPILAERPITVVVTGDDLRPWKEQATRFAVLQDERFLALGDRSELASRDEPVLQHLLSSPHPRS